MRKVVLYIATSLDNYIAKPDGGTDWLHTPEFAIPNEDYGYGKLIESIDTTLMGNNTYRQVESFEGPFPYADKTNFVFTRSQSNIDNDHVSFISGDVADFVRKLKESEGKNIWLIGGGQINSILLDNDLIDSLILTLIPTTLGDGIPLFSGKSNQMKFELVESKSYDSGLIQLTYNTTKT